MLAGQRINDGVEQAVGLGNSGLRGDAADGVGSYGHGQVGHAQGPAFHVAQALEEMAADGYGRDAPPFQFDRVVDTPRGAGASIAQANDGHLHGGGHLLDYPRLCRDGGGGLAAVKGRRYFVLLP